jgi:multiple sugar transport system ATP-binding protein
MTMGQRVAVLRDGRLQQCDTPRALYDRPTNVFVAGFIGSPAMTLCTVPVNGDGGVELGGARVELDHAPRDRATLTVGLRPESLELAGDGIAARVQVVEELGADAYVICVGEVAGEETRLVARADPRNPPSIGDRVSLRVRGDEAHLFDADSGVRL